MVAGRWPEHVNETPNQGVHALATDSEWPEVMVMELVHARCCGLDIHKDSIMACVRLAEGGNVVEEVRRFSTMTGEILKLGDWLRQCVVRDVAMEATGVYWKPIWNLLEDEFALVLVNAQHMRAVPGRKTDVKDCEWIAQLLQCGLLRASFVPPRDRRELVERPYLPGVRSRGFRRTEGAGRQHARVGRGPLRRT